MHDTACDTECGAASVSKRPPAAPCTHRSCWARWSPWPLCSGRRGSSCSLGAGRWRCRRPTTSLGGRWRSQRARNPGPSHSLAGKLVGIGGKRTRAHANLLVKAVRVLSSGCRGLAPARSSAIDRYCFQQDKDSRAGAKHHHSQSMQSPAGRGTHRKLRCPCPQCPGSWCLGSMGCSPSWDCRQCPRWSTYPHSRACSPKSHSQPGRYLMVVECAVGANCVVIVR